MRVVVRGVHCQWKDARLQSNWSLLELFLLNTNDCEILDILELFFISTIPTGENVNIKSFHKDS